MTSLTKPQDGAGAQPEVVVLRESPDVYLTAISGPALGIHAIVVRANNKLRGSLVPTFKAIKGLLAER